MIGNLLPHFPLPSLLSFDYLSQVLPPFNFILMEKAEGVTFSKYIQLYHPSSLELSDILSELSSSISLLSSIQSNHIGCLYFSNSPSLSLSPPLSPSSFPSPHHSPTQPVNRPLFFNNNFHNNNVNNNGINNNNDNTVHVKVEGEGGNEGRKGGKEREGKEVHFWKVNKRGEREEEMEEKRERGRYKIGPLPESTNQVFDRTGEYVIQTCHYYVKFLISSEKYGKSFEEFVQPISRFYEHVEKLFGEEEGPFHFCHNDVLPDNFLLFPPHLLRYYNDNEEDNQIGDNNNNKEERKRRRISAIIDYEWSLFIPYDVIFSSINLQENHRQFVVDQLKENYFYTMGNGKTEEIMEERKKVFGVVDALLSWAKSEFWFAHNEEVQNAHYLTVKSLLLSYLTSLNCI